MVGINPGSIEVNPLDEDVRGSQQDPVSYPDHCDIVPDPLNQRRINGGHPLSDSLYESKLTDVAEHHFSSFSL
jgi:hypothetical protein